MVNCEDARRGSPSWEPCQLKEKILPTRPDGGLAKSGVCMTGITHMQEDGREGWENLGRPLYRPYGLQLYGSDSPIHCWDGRAPKLSIDTPDIGKPFVMGGVTERRS